MNTSVSSRVRRGLAERGQAAVETGLVILPLLAILCALIDFSMAMFIRNSLVASVREGVRYAITGQIGAGGATCQDASIKNIVQQNSMGLLAGEDGLVRIKLNYYSPATLVDVTDQPRANAGGNVVRVSVYGVSWLWMISGLWAPEGQYTGLTMSAASSDVMEPPPNGAPPCR
jgi:Flp pilus assembly protein TadG